MDIEYLLILQNARELMPSPLESFFILLSSIADGIPLVVLTLIIYWCVDKHAGLLAAWSFGIGNFVCQFIKNLVCAYRPWIRDARILPSTEAIPAATGYSFPSGHTNGATTILGSFAWIARKKHRVIMAICLISILIIAFSRNLLGVHTPQDVLVGFIIGVLSIVVAHYFLKWIDLCDANKPGHNYDVYAVLAVCIICLISFIVLEVKSFPLDYVEGILLVDPDTMKKGSYEGAGLFMGIALGWLLERRTVGFSTQNLTMKNRIIRGIVGIVLSGGVYFAIDILMKMIFAYNVAKLISMFLLGIMALYVAPLVFARIEQTQQKTK